MVEWILIAAIIIASIVWYLRAKWWRRRARNIAMRQNAGLEVLAARYARGEIDREEYLQKRDDILGSQAALEGQL
jgi:putative membrane protein